MERLRRWGTLGPNKEIFIEAIEDKAFNEFSFDRALLSSKGVNDYDFIVTDARDAPDSEFREMLLLMMIALLASIFFYFQYATQTEKNFNERVIQALDLRNTA